MSFVTASQLLRAKTASNEVAPPACNAVSGKAAVKSKGRGSLQRGQQTLCFKAPQSSHRCGLEHTAVDTAGGSGNGSVPSSQAVIIEDSIVSASDVLDLSPKRRRVEGDIVELRSLLVGRRFHTNGSEGLQLLAEGVPNCPESRLRVTLEREPGNRYDAFALLVRCIGGPDAPSCGHIPREHARILSPMIDKGLITVLGEVSVKGLLDVPLTDPVALHISVRLSAESQEVLDALASLADLHRNLGVASAARPLQVQRKPRQQCAQRSLLRNFGRGSQSKVSAFGKGYSSLSLSASVGGAGLIPDVSRHMSIRAVMIFRSAGKEWRLAVDQLRCVRYRVAVESFVSGIRPPASLPLPSDGQLHPSRCLDGIVEAVGAWAPSPLSLEAAAGAVAAVVPAQTFDCLVDAFQSGGVALNGWQAFALAMWLAPSADRLAVARVALLSGAVHVDELRELAALLVMIAWRACRSGGGCAERLFADLLVCNRLLEDAGIKFPPSGLRMPGVQLTEEQNAIIAKDVGDDEQLIISAFAGTGKTSTLRMYACLRPHLRFLYLCFNVSVREEAQRSFPANVTCKNAHQLAFAKCGFKFTHKLKDDLRIEDVASHPLFNGKSSIIGDCKGRMLNEMRMEAADACLAVLQNFMNSASSDIGLEHLPNPLPEIICRGTLTTSSACNAAKTLWREMRDAKNDNVKMTHNGYLKLYSLYRPTLDYDVVLLDEAQDCNPAIASIVVSQKCARILVGDTHQSIYGFLGATDVLRTVSAANDAELGEPGVLYRRRLTRSFRFGPNVADLANFILRRFKGETQPLLGCGKHLGQIDLHFSEMPDSRLEGCPPTPFTFVARTNAAVVQMALRADDAGLSIAWVGGVRGYKLNLLRDLCLLALGCQKDIESKRVRSFSSLEGLRQFSKRINDRDALARIELVRRHSPQDLLDRLRHLESTAERCEKSTVSVRRDVSLATLHKAKGLEWDAVMLADDFVEPHDLASPGMSQEVNALYVGVTRAMRVLRLPRALSTFYFTSAEALAIVDASSLPGDGSNLCPGCGVRSQALAGVSDEHLQSLPGSRIATVGKSKVGGALSLPRSSLGFVGSIGLQEMCGPCSRRLFPERVPDELEEKMADLT